MLQLKLHTQSDQTDTWQLRSPLGLVGGGVGSLGQTPPIHEHLPSPILMQLAPPTSELSQHLGSDPQSLLVHAAVSGMHSKGGVDPGLFSHL